MNVLAKSSALLALLGVGLGAFGAHALKESLEASGSMENWRTAVYYQLFHAIALFALSVSMRGSDSRVLKTVGWLWVVGIVLFSGSLYGLTTAGWKWLGPITPLGGLSLMAGWAILLFSQLPKGGSGKSGS